jgi:hypothetical protein
MGDGGAGAMAAGGASDGGGGSGPLPPYDWAPSLTATWRFNLSNNIGKDAGPNGLDLETIVGAPSTTSNSIEGSGALTLPLGATLGSEASDFRTTNSMTFGGWFRTDLTVSAGLMGRKSSGHGYVAEYLGAQATAKCWWEAEGAIALAIAPDNLWPTDQWVHFVCRYDANTHVVSALMDGQTRATVASELSLAEADFAINWADFPYAGQVDEAFFINEDLSDAAVRRIYACGIAGTGCACDPNEWSSYTDCGRAEPNCAALPPCDAPTP